MAAPSMQELTKGMSGLPQQQACDRHITEHDDAKVLGNQEDYSDENESFALQIKTVFKAE